jgi:hypothetical protein
MPFRTVMLCAYRDSPYKRERGGGNDIVAPRRAGDGGGGGATGPIAVASASSSGAGARTRTRARARRRRRALLAEGAEGGLPGGGGARLQLPLPVRAARVPPALPWGAGTLHYRPLCTSSTSRAERPHQPARRGGERQRVGGRRVYDGCPRERAPNRSQDAQGLVIGARDSEKGVRLAQKMQAGPGTPAGIRPQKAEVDPTSGPTRRLSHARAGRGGGQVAASKEDSLKEDEFEAALGCASGRGHQAISRIRPSAVAADPEPPTLIPPGTPWNRLEPPETTTNVVWRRLKPPCNPEHLIMT